MFNYFKDIKSDEIKVVAGGCQCVCNRKPDTSTEDLLSIGKAKSLSECSEVCINSGWKIAKCEAPKKIEKDKEE